MNPIQPTNLIIKGYADYMIILSQSESVCEQTNTHKSYAKRIIGLCHTDNEKVHIIIKPMPRRKSYMAEPEIMGLKTSMTQLPPVSLTVDGFGFFSHGA